MKSFIISFLFILPFSLFSQSRLEYHSMDQYTIVGRSFPLQTTFKRFPDSLEKLLRKPVWDLSKNSAGLAIVFETNSTQLSAKWATTGGVTFQHVAGSLVKGIDLYALDKEQWYYAGIGRPAESNKHESNIIKDLDGKMRQYLLYLPCYDNTDSIMIGIDSGAIMHTFDKNTVFKGKPIVFYGTSIMQGASAMRPGMAHAAIIERRMHVETINLGFSGNGQLDSMLAVIMSSIDASCYVIDCGPNLTPQMAQERTIPFIQQLKKNRPLVPVLLVANIEYPTARFNETINHKIKKINSYFLDAYKTLLKQGYKEIYYLPSKGLIGDDGEGTVDGTHLTDLGFYRLANVIEKKLRDIIH